MTLLISKGLRKEILGEARRTNREVVEQVRQMYLKRLDRADRRGHLSAERKAACVRRIDSNILTEFWL